MQWLDRDGQGLASLPSFLTIQVKFLKAVVKVLAVVIGQQRVVVVVLLFIVCILAGRLSTGSVWAWVGATALFSTPDRGLPFVGFRAAREGSGRGARCGQL